MKVMIVVTHLLGTGHLRRAMTLAHAFVAADQKAYVMSGGHPVAGLETKGVDLIQMPPLKSDGVNFTTLLRSDGSLADESDFAARRASLIEALDAIRPDVLITELFPFGRRVLAEEFLTLLDAATMARSKPLILSSIRDILAPPSKPAKAERADRIIAQYYDAVLVHSDETATPLPVSWPVTPALKARLQYTGFVAAPPPAAHPELAGTEEVLVSAGGGAVGSALFQTARKAAERAPDLRWRLLIGGTDPDALIASLKNGAPETLIVEVARPDFRQMLHHALCSVSMAGYNTAMDLLQTGCPAVLIPFDDGGEVEQTLRAKSLSELPGFSLLPGDMLTPETLIKTVRELAKTPRRSPAQVSLDGAARTVQIVKDLLEARE